MPFTTENTVDTNWRLKGNGFVHLMNSFPYPAQLGAPLPILNNYQTFTPIDLADEMTINGWGQWVSTEGVGGTQTANIALYLKNDNNAPTGQPILSLDNANALDFTSSPAGLNIVNLVQPITIPAGSYYLSVTTALTGASTTTAAIYYNSANDGRLGSTNINANVGGLAWTSPQAKPGLAPPMSDLAGGISWLVYLRESD